MPCREQEEKHCRQRREELAMKEFSLSSAFSSARAK